jgi:hypothetical protein
MRSDANRGRRDRCCALALSALFVCGLAPMLGCERPVEAGSRFEYNDSSGVRIAINRGEDRTLEFVGGTADSLLADADGGAYIVSRTTPQWLRVDAKGQIFVLDVDRSEVARFSKHGLYIGATGRGGRGPGELAMPISIALASDTLVVFDEARRVQVRWALRGSELLAEKPYDRGSSVVPPLAIRGDAYVRIQGWVPDGAGVVSVVWSDDSVPVFELADTISRRAVSTRCRLPPQFNQLPPLGSPTVHAAAGGGALAVSGGTSEYEVWLLRAGTDSPRVTGVRRDVRPRQARRADSRNEAEMYYRVTTNSARCEVTWGELESQVGVWPTVPTVSGLAVTNDGSLWVKRDESEEGRVDVFSANGRYRGTLARSMLPTGSLPDGRFLIPRRDEYSGGLVVAIARIDWVP